MWLRDRLPALWIVWLLIAAHSAHAHHTVGHAGAPSAFSGSTGNDLRAPTTFIGLGCAGDATDHARGAQLQYQLYGEYAITPRISVGGQLPFQSIRDTSRAASDGIADLVLTSKADVWASAQNDWHLLASLAASLPTGDPDAGRGSGRMAMAPSVAVTKQWARAQLFASAGMTAALASAGQPALHTRCGASLQLRSQYPMIDLSASWQGQTLLANSVFTSGSSKGFASTAVLVQWSPHWRSTLGGRVSVLDTLAIRPDVMIGPDAVALLIDVVAGGLINMEFIF